MKKSDTFIIAFLLLGLSTGSYGKYLIWKDEIPTFSAKPDKALIVVLRPARRLSDPTAFYVNKKFVAGTYSKTVTSFELDPGEHLIVAFAHVARMAIKDHIKCNFKAGKIYYILQVVHPPYKATTLTFMTREEAMKTLESEKDDLKYCIANPEDPLDDLRDRKWNKIMIKWIEWAEENADEVRKMMLYPGY